MVKQADEVTRSTVPGATSESTCVRSCNQQPQNTQTRYTVTVDTSVDTPRSTKEIHVVKRSKRSRALAPQAYVATVDGVVQSKHRSRLMPSDLHNIDFSAFYASALAGYPEYPSVFNASSKRVRVATRLNNLPVDHITIDTACYIPCISEAFMRLHNTLKHAKMFPVPRGVINLRSADNSSLKIKGYARFNLTLEDITLPVETLALPSLSPDNMLLDNSIMGAFGAERLIGMQKHHLASNQTALFQQQYRRTRNPTTNTSGEDNYSIVVQDGKAESFPVYLIKKCCIPARSEIAIEIHSTVAPPA